VTDINRREFVRMLLAGATAAAAPSLGLLPACRRSRRPPNVIIFLADDLGYGDLPCYGNPINRTPHLDRFAAEGTRFTDFHAAGTVCSPSRASLLTGRHPFRLGFYYILGGGAHLKREEITIASLLRSSGYDTCFVGKWHLTDFDSPEKGQPDPGDHGFDHWFGTVLNAFEGPENPEKFYRNGVPTGTLEGWYCDLITREAISWLEARKRPDRPFFLLACSHEPHTPIEPPDSFADRFDGEEVDRLEDGVAYGRVPRPENKDIEGNKKYYYGTVAQLDAAFGRLMTAVDDLGLRDDTLVLFTSDNGPEYPVNFMESRGQWDDPIRDRCFGTPGPLRGMKRFTYEGGHRVPGIVRWPGHTPKGAVSDALINGTDILPTLCGLVGIDLPGDRAIDGESVTAALTGKPFSREKPVCWSAPVHEYEFVPPLTLRRGDYVLVAWFNDKPAEQLWMEWVKTTGPVRYELYDVLRDPGQSEDLSSRMPGRVEELAAEMGRIWKDIQDEAPIWPEWKAR
jgi:arylsulfatase A